jgi:hypothetical protein
LYIKCFERKVYVLLDNCYTSFHQEFYHNFVEMSYTFELIPSNQTLEYHAADGITNIHMKAYSALAIVKRQVALPM